MARRTATASATCGSCAITAAVRPLEGRATTARDSRRIQRSPWPTSTTSRMASRWRTRTWSSGTPATSSTTRTMAAAAATSSGPSSAPSTGEATRGDGGSVSPRILVGRGVSDESPVWGGAAGLSPLRRQAHLYRIFRPPATGGERVWGAAGIQLYQSCRLAG